MEVEDKMWWWGQDGQQRGPVKTVDMVMQLMSGKVSDDTLVWCADMENWTKASEVEELQDLVTLLQSRTMKPSWSAPPGDHVVPAECSEWIDNISPDARVSLFHTAINKYMPAIIRGHQEARDALLQAFISRQCGPADIVD